MSESVGGKARIDGAGLASALEAALASVRKQTKAQVGDKTMMDALVPAIQAVRAATDAGASPAEALAKAAAAAEAGAASTKDMRARFGRAKNLGDRSIGSPDPGATSMSLIFKGFAEALK